MQAATGSHWSLIKSGMIWVRFSWLTTRNVTAFWTFWSSGQKSQKLNLSKLKLEVVVFINTHILKRQLRLKVSPGAMTGKAGCHLHMGKDGWVTWMGQQPITWPYVSISVCKGTLTVLHIFVDTNYDTAASQPTPPTDWATTVSYYPVSLFNINLTNTFL